MDSTPWFTTDMGPYSVISADFNGDGNPDLATASLRSDTVSVLLGDGSGGFGAKTDFTTGAAPYRVSSADFDGDGNPDLAVPGPPPSRSSFRSRHTASS